MPGNARVADPGFVATTPGSGVIMIAPVSVCHHVSTTGQRPPPMFRSYQIHASGLIGSPTLPRRRNEERSCAFGSDSPHFMNAHDRSEEHTSELQSRRDLVCRLLLEKKKTNE